MDTHPRYGTGRTFTSEVMCYKQRRRRASPTICMAALRTAYGRVSQGRWATLKAFLHLPQ